MALRATHAGQLAEYALIEGGAGRIGPVAPLIAVPTTAGTGSEVGRAALITLRDGRKLALISGHLIPARAICDPELTLGLPPLLTAATGMDALTHCIETFLSPRYNPPADAIALDGAGRAMRFLPRAVAEGGDREARAEMMMAALQGGLTFQKGLGAVHGLSHALGAIPDPVLHHGTLNAVILPAVLRFNAPAAAAKYPRLARAMGAGGGRRPRRRDRGSQRPDRPAEEPAPDGRDRGASRPRGRRRRGRPLHRQQRPAGVAGRITRRCSTPRWADAGARLRLQDRQIPAAHTWRAKFFKGVGTSPWQGVLGVHVRIVHEPPLFNSGRPSGRPFSCAPSTPIGA